MKHKYQLPWMAVPLMMTALLVVATVPCESVQWPTEIRNTTGVITAVDDQVITIYGSMAFYPTLIGRAVAPPEAELGVPEWATVGTEVSVSYIVQHQRRFYLEIIRPGAPFLVKQAIEEVAREKR